LTVDLDPIRLVKRAHNAEFLISVDDSVECFHYDCRIVQPTDEANADTIARRHSCHNRHRVDVHALERVDPSAVITIREVSASIEIARDIAEREEWELHVREPLSVEQTGVAEDSRQK
jgi:hypothetical protein